MTTTSGANGSFTLSGAFNETTSIPRQQRWLHHGRRDIPSALRYMFQLCGFHARLGPTTGEHGGNLHRHAHSRQRVRWFSGWTANADLSGDRRAGAHEHALHHKLEPHVRRCSTDFNWLGSRNCCCRRFRPVLGRQLARGPGFHRADRPDNSMSRSRERPGPPLAPSRIDNLCPLKGTRSIAS